MSNKYSEDQLIEQTCIDIFKNQLQTKCQDKHWNIQIAQMTELLAKLKKNHNQHQ